MNEKHVRVRSHGVAGSLPAVLLGTALALGSFGAVAPASAQVGVGIEIGIPPPPPRYEPVPVVPAGYVWAPGYWEWFHGTHVWRRGHLMEERRGYRWAPDHWEERGGHHQFVPGRWDR